MYCLTNCPKTPKFKKELCGTLNSFCVACKANLASRLSRMNVRSWSGVKMKVVRTHGPRRSTSRKLSFHVTLAFITTRMYDWNTSGSDRHSCTHMFFLRMKEERNKKQCRNFCFVCSFHFVWSSLFFPSDLFGQIKRSRLYCCRKTRRCVRSLVFVTVQNAAEFRVENNYCDVRKSA